MDDIFDDFGDQDALNQAVTPDLTQSPADPFSDFQAKNPINSNIKAAVPVNPDEAVKHRKLSEVSGMPIEAVEADPEAVDAFVREQEVANSITPDKPVLSRFMQNPQNAKEAHDDVKELGFLEELWMLAADAMAPAAIADEAERKTISQIPRSMIAGAVRAEENVNRFNQTLLELIGWDSAAEGADWIADYYGQTSDTIRGDISEMSPTAQTVMSGAESAGNSLVMLPLGAVNSMAGLLGLGVNTFGQSSEEGRNAGLDPGTNALYSLQQAGVEVITEKLPFEGLTKYITEGGNFKRLLAAQFIQEGIGEQIATAWQDLNSWLMLNPEKSAQEYLAERPDRALETAIATATATMLQTGASTIISRPYQLESIRADDADTMFQVVEGAHDQLANSQLGQRDPNKLAQYQADVIKQQGIERVGIPADQFMAVFGDKVVDVLGEMGIELEQFENAFLQGQDISLTAEQFSKHVLMNDQMYEQLAPHVRYNDQMLTKFEADEFRKNGLADEVEKSMLKAAMAAPIAYDINNPLVYEALTEAGFSNQEIATLTPEDVAALLAPGSPATQDETIADADVTLAEDELGLHGLFTSAKEAGMTEKQFEQYLIRVGQSALSSRRAQVKKYLKAREFRNSAEWQKAKEPIEAGIRETVQNEPVYQAINNIQATRLDREALVALLPDGEAGLERLPKQGKRNIFTNKGETGGVDPEVYAAQNGFDGADIMLFTMIDAIDMESEIEIRTEAAMEQQFPDLVNERIAINEAMESIHNDHTAELLAEELNWLKQAKKEKRISHRLVGQAAREFLQQYRMEDINPGKFLQTEKSWAKTAARFLRKGDREMAADAKFKQLMNHQMAMEAYRIRKQVDRDHKYLSQFLKTRKDFDTVDADYIDAIRNILSDYKLGSRMSNKRRDYLKAWAVAHAVETGQTVQAIDDRLFRDDAKKNWRDASLEEWEQLVNSVKMLHHQGREQKLYKLGKEKIQFEDVVSKMLDKSSNLKELGYVEHRRATTEATAFDTVEKWVRGIDAQFTKTEFILQKLDNGEMAGPWHQAIYQKAADAVSDQADMTRKHFVPIIEELDKIISKEGNTLNQRVDLGNKRGTRANLLMMALNTGNVSNMRKLLDGSSKQNGVPGLTPETLNRALGQVTEAEWKWVQKVWDKFEEMRPIVEQIYRDEHGHAPERIEPVEFTTATGVKMKGGYFPVMYDRTIMEVDPVTEGTTTEEMFEASLRRGTVYSGMTKARTGYTAPVLLDINALPKVTEQLIHYVTHYNAVKDIRRMLTNKQVAAEIKAKVGDAAQRELTQWMDSIARPHGKPAELPYITPLVNWLRTNTVAATLGGSFTTAASQLLGRFTSVSVLGQTEEGGFNVAKGEYWLASGYATYARNPVEATKAAFSESKELRHRLTSVDRDIAAQMKRLQGKKGLWAKQQRAGLMAIGGLQLYTIDIPTWLAAKNKGLSEGRSNENAINYADSVVRMSQGSGHMKDLSAIQRSSNPFNQLFTMFSTYIMVAYNLERQTIGNIARKPIKNLPGAIARLSWLLVLPALADALMRGEPPEEEEGVLQWAANKTFGYSIGTLPVIGGAARSAAEGFDPSKSVTPISQLGSAIWEATQAIKEYDSDFGIQEEGVRKVLRAFGLFTGITGTAQINRILKELENNWDDPIYDIPGYEYMIGHRD